MNNINPSHIIDEHLVDLEIDLLLQALKGAYGYDFMGYARSHVRRRIMHRLAQSSEESISRMIHRVLREPNFANQLIQDLSIRVTEMFRDPPFYKVLREHVIPLLKTWSHIHIWHAGCSTGEEVYSMAILLKEEGLYDRSQIYATDINQESIDVAKAGIYPVERIKKYAQNYQESGAKGAFSDYFYADYYSAILDASLKENIIWANHNLVTDSDFAEMHLILCRNVMIYFNKDLQNRVHGLFYESLVRGGFLCLGSKENIEFSTHEKHYDIIDKKQRVYKKKYRK